MLGNLFKRKGFNDTLALIFGVGIPGLWVLNHWYPMPSEAVGASIAGWTMIIVHYFRKKAP